MGQFYFGLGAIGVYEDNALLGFSEVPGEIKATIMGGISRSMGGASLYPVAARKTRSEGGVTISLNERPEWVDELANAGSKEDTAAAAAATITSVNSTGTSVASLTVTADADAYYGTYSVKVTGASAVEVTYTGAGGVIKDDMTLTVAAAEFKTTGVKILKPSSATLVTDDVTVYTITPAHDGISVISVPQIKASKEYSLKAWSAVGGASDSIEELEIPRLIFDGADYGFTDNEPVTGVEITGSLLSPTNGESVLKRKIIKITA